MSTEVIKIALDGITLSYKILYQSGREVGASEGRVKELLYSGKYIPWGKRGNQFVWLIREAPKPKKKAKTKSFRNATYEDR